MERNNDFIEMAIKHGVPDHMIEGFELYVFHHIEPGSFLRAVLENDLKGAIGRADYINISAIKEIVTFVYLCVPFVCQGSPEKVHDWLTQKNLARKTNL